MAETTTTGVLDESSAGLVFRDGPEDIARLARYEDYLRLQSRAGEMSNAEYLAELDKIMEQGDQFDRGETQYGSDAPSLDSEQSDLEQAEQLRANLEDDGSEPEQDGNAFLLSADDTSNGEPNLEPELRPGAGGNGTILEQPPGAAAGIIPDDAESDGVDGQDIMPDGIDPGLADESGGVPIAVSDDERDAGVAEPESFLGNGMIIHDMPEGSLEAGSGVLDSAGRVAPETGVSDGDVSLEAGSPAVGVSDGGAAPETVGPVEPGLDAEILMPAADHSNVVDAEFEPQANAGTRMAGHGESHPEMAAAEQPAPSGPSVYHVPGHVEIHEEQFQTTDFLDELSVSTGLASSVQTAEYIPPQDITIQAPDSGDGKESVPERSPKMQALMDRVARERQAEYGLSGLDGPSV